MRHGYFRIPLTLLIVASVAALFQLSAAGILWIWTSIHGVPFLSASSTSELAATGIAQLGVMMFGTYFLVRFFKQNPLASLRLEGFYETPPLAYIVALPLMLSAQVVGSMIAVLWEHVLMHAPQLYSSIKQYEDVVEETTKGAAISATTLPHALIVVICIAIIPALAEETLFRGFAQSNIERSGKWKPRPYAAILSASLAFAIVHLEPVELPGLLILGMALGWMSYRTNNLLVGSVAHAANNGIIVLVLMLLPAAGEGDSAAGVLGNAPESVSYALATLAKTLPVLLLCIYFFHRITRQLSARNNSWVEFEEANGGGEFPNGDDEYDFPFHD